MRTTEEVLAYIDEQLWYINDLAKEKGLKKPLLAKIGEEPTQNTYEDKYWLYQTLKWFIQGEI